MKKLKRLAAMGLTACMTLSVFAGSASAEEAEVNNGEPITLTMMGWKRSRRHIMKNIRM